LWAAAVFVVLVSGQRVLTPVFGMVRNCSAEVRRLGRHESWNRLTTDLLLSGSMPNNS
jgi:hypothetical protein